MVNIPLSLLGAIVALWLTGETVNIMTLGGLALAIGILVDESTVTIENVHAHLARGQSLVRAVSDSRREIAVPLLISMLCVLAVFVPSFTMTGAARCCRPFAGGWIFNGHFLSAFEQFCANPVGMDSSP